MNTDEMSFTEGIMSKGGILLLLIVFISFVVSADVWHVKRVDYEPGVQSLFGDRSSQKLDTNGYPHISYFNGENDSMKYSYWNGSTWIIESIDGADYGLTSLSLNEYGYGHITCKSEILGRIELDRLYRGDGVTDHTGN